MNREYHQSKSNNLQFEKRGIRANVYIFVFVWYVYFGSFDNSSRNQFFRQNTQKMFCIIIKEHVCNSEIEVSLQT